MRFRDYPLGFRALALFDAAYAVVIVVGYPVYAAISGGPTGAQTGAILGTSIIIIETLAYVLLVWRYRLRAGNPRTSIFILFLAIIAWFVVTGIVLRLLNV